jgi:hypothetical protein
METRRFDLPSALAARWQHGSSVPDLGLEWRIAEPMIEFDNHITGMVPIGSTLYEFPAEKEISRWDVVRAGR